MISDAALDSAIQKLFSEITFTDQPEGLYDPLRYMISIGGKMAADLPAGNNSFEWNDSYASTK